jgi:hypothetical protein
MKKLTAVLLALFFAGSTGLVLAGTSTGQRMHKPYVKHHKKGKKDKKGAPAPTNAGMENRVNN